MDKQKMEKRLDMEQLEGVAGGTYIDSTNVANFLAAAGFKNAVKDGSTFPNLDGMRSALKELGFSSHDHGGIKALGGKENTYTQDATGKTFSQADMMNFLKNKYPGVQIKEIAE